MTLAGHQRGIQIHRGLFQGTTVGPVLSDAYLRFKAPVQYPDDILVGARVCDVGPIDFVMEYLVRRVSRPVSFSRSRPLFFSLFVFLSLFVFVSLSLSSLFFLSSSFALSVSGTYECSL